MVEKNWHNLSWREVLNLLGSDSEKGLSEKEAKLRQKKFGKNRLPKKKPFSRVKLLLEQLKSPLIYILIIVGILVLLLEEYPHNLIESGFVFIVIIINSLFGFWEENKTSKTLEKLRKILKTKTIVIRGGKKKEVFQEELVPGDIILLKPGDKVPADGRLIETENLKINEATLTGEWLPTSKKTETLPERTALADRDNMVYAGNLVENGRGKAVVTSIGEKTEIGKISLLIQETKEEKTPLQKKLEHFGRFIGGLIVFVCISIFLVGIIRGESPLEMFETAAAISVGGIPEALPVLMTLVLVIGMERLLKKKGLVRKLASVETLGSTSVICVDKTKTLTQGKMELDRVVSGDKKLTLKIAVLCNESFVENPTASYKNWKVRGSPTDKALLLAGAQFGILRKNLEKEYKILNTVPFDSQKKYEASLVKFLKEDKNFIFISGAPERLLELSRLTKIEERNLREKLDELTQKGLRVIGIAKKEVSSKEPRLERAEITDLDFVGFISLKDPLRKGVKKAIKICKESGLKPVVITGDHRLTAKTIARKIGLEIKDENIIEGGELDKIPDAKLEKIVPKIKIYSRAEPRHKIRIVRAWQKRGKIVAMTGDGVNDAPALKKADIGIGLGSGTEVAKESSDLILLTDGFDIIVRAIREGRIILDNIRKSISYILADSFTSVILVGFSMIFGWPLPILWIQILWNNIIEDTFPVISYAFEPEEKGIMKRGPALPRTPLLTKEMKVLIFGTGLIDEFLTLFLFWILWGYLKLDLDYVRTMVFGALCLDTAFVIYCYKNLRKNLWKINPFNNKFLLISSGLVVIGLALAIYIHPLQILLSTVPLGIKSWLLLIIIGIISMILIEATKWYFISRRETEKY